MLITEEKKHTWEEYSCCTWHVLERKEIHKKL